MQVPTRSLELCYGFPELKNEVFSSIRKRSFRKSSFRFLFLEEKERPSGEDVVNGI